MGPMGKGDAAIFVVIFWLGIVGALALLGGGIWLIVWLASNLQWVGG